MTGAVYALLGMALVLVFSVTRVISLAQGEFVSFSALTLAAMQAGQIPGLAWLLGGMAIIAGAMEALDRWRDGDVRRLRRSLPLLLVLPMALSALCIMGLAGKTLWIQVGLCLAMVTCMGLLIYRIAYQPLAKASILTLLIASVAVHLVLTGLGLLFFGVDGVRTPAFWDARLQAGGVVISGQALIVVAVTIALIAGLWVWFAKTLTGTALRATASNQLGARLMGISVPAAGAMSFALSGFIGGLCGLLIGPLVTIYYDSGLLIGLKGFVAAVIGAFTSYPITLVGALGVGILEVAASFWASAYKEVVVFLVIIPVMLVLSWRHCPDDGAY